jgi:hypothetical protein
VPHRRAEEGSIQAMDSPHNSFITIRGEAVANESFGHYYDAILGSPNVKILFWKSLTLAVL